MRPGRAVLLAALPAVGLAGVLTHVSGLPTAVPASHGGGTITPLSAVRIVTDGSPQLLALPVPAPAPQPSLAPVLLPAPGVVVAPRAAGRTSTPKVVAPPRPAPQASYPYATSSGTDPWGFTMRQCVSYIAWRLDQVGRPIDNARQGWGDATSWDQVASQLGVTVTTRPSVGAVAQWEGGERSPYWGAGSATSNGTFAAGPLGHVAWVTQVFADGSVEVAQYNGSGDQSYSTMRVKAPRYLLL